MQPLAQKVYPPLRDYFKQKIKRLFDFVTDDDAISITNHDYVKEKIELFADDLCYIEISDTSGTSNYPFVTR